MSLATDEERREALEQLTQWPGYEGAVHYLGPEKSVINSPEDFSLGFKDYREMMMLSLFPEPSDVTTTGGQKFTIEEVETHGIKGEARVLRLKEESKSYSWLTVAMSSNGHFLALRYIAPVEGKRTIQDVREMHSRLH